MVKLDHEFLPRRGGVPVSFAMFSTGGRFVEVSSCATLISWVENRIKRSIPINSSDFLGGCFLSIDFRVTEPSDI